MSESKKTVFVVGLGPGGGQFLTCLLYTSRCVEETGMVSRMACWLMGSTMPLVPRTLRPPSTPIWGLKVR